MIVDDSGVIRKVAKRILTSIDLVVIEASTGYGALNLCELDMPDIIVLDTGLPDIDSTDFIRQLKGVEGSASPQILLLMTEFDIGTYMRAKRAGAGGYLLKPFERRHLVERVRQMKIAA